MRHPKILTTLKTYDGAQFAADLLAGATVAMVALPLSLAIAIASGADPAKGLVTAVVGGFLISALGGSRVQIGGPTGAFIVVVFGVIAEHGYDGLVIATFMAGFMLLILAGYLRAGRSDRPFPEAVINGFTIGIAVIIATSQVKDLLGLSMEPLPADFVEKLTALWEALATLGLAGRRNRRPDRRTHRPPAPDRAAFSGAHRRPGGGLGAGHVPGLAGRHHPVALWRSARDPAWPDPARPDVVAHRRAFSVRGDIAFLAGIESLAVGDGRRPHDRQPPPPECGTAGAGCRQYRHRPCSAVCPPRAPSRVPRRISAPGARRRSPGSFMR